MITRRDLRRQLAAANTRTAKAIEDRDEAYSVRDSALDNQRRRAVEITEAREELDALRKTGNDPAAWAVERQDLRRQLLLANGARARLSKRLEELQAANEALNQAAAARAAQDEEAMTA